MACKDCKSCVNEGICFGKGVLGYETGTRCRSNNYYLFKDRNRFIELPCKVGDTVYLIHRKNIELCEVISFYISQGNRIRLRPIFQPYIGNKSIYYTPLITKFNKTIFLEKDKPEAEKRLEELNKNE